MVKVFVNIPSLVCIVDAFQPYHIFPYAPANDGVIRGCIHTDSAINPVNKVGPLLDVKGGRIVINKAIVTMSGSNRGIDFRVPVDRFKPAVEYIVSTYRLLGGGGGRGSMWRVVRYFSVMMRHY